MDKAFKPLSPTQLQSTADYNHTRYFEKDVPVGTTVEHVMTPTWWRHHGHLKPFDTVELVTTDHSLHVLLMVKTVGVGFVKMRMLDDYIKNAAELAPAGAETPVIEAGELVVEHCPGGNPPHNWRVKRGTAIIAKGFEDKAEATRYANDYLKEIGAAPAEKAA